MSQTRPAGLRTSGPAGVVCLLADPAANSRSSGQPPVAHRAPEETGRSPGTRREQRCRSAAVADVRSGVEIFTLSPRGFDGPPYKFPPPPRPNRSFFRDRLQDGERFCPVGYSRISRSGADIRRHIRHRNTSAVRGHAPSSDRVQSRRCPMGGAWLVPPCCERPPVRSLWAFWK
jgi:hypothetical protein